jgi:hypothetical protein
MKNNNTKIQKVAEVQYRCGGNYKTSYVMFIPVGKQLKVGDDVTVNDFGISDEKWYNELLPGKYDAELDHNILEVLAIRDRKEDDMPVNRD